MRRESYLPAMLIAGLALAGCDTWTGASSQGGTDPVAAVGAAGEAARFPEAARFAVDHALEVAVPDGAESVRIWFTIPAVTAKQTIAGFEVQSDHPYTFVRDRTGATEMLYVHVEQPEEETIRIGTSFELARREVRTALDPAAGGRALTDSELRRLAPYLQPAEHVIINDKVRELAREAVGDATDPVDKARRIYDYVLETIDYWVKDPDAMRASPVGSTQHCLDTGAGNCTDFHTFYVSLARAAELPSRLVYGAFFKQPLDGADRDSSYHCWVEFYAPGLGWVPLDVSLADLFTHDIELTEANRELVELTTPFGYAGADAGLVDYYFGNLEPRRVTFSYGRDLELGPEPWTGPVNDMSRAYVEIDGEPATYTRKLTYSEIAP